MNIEEKEEHLELIVMYLTKSGSIKTRIKVPERIMSQVIVSVEKLKQSLLDNYPTLSAEWKK